MTKDDVIRLAREAGMNVSMWNYGAGSMAFTMGIEGVARGAIERFADLVAAAEREECAKVCDDKAAHCETKAQEAVENGEHDEVNVIRSTAWQIMVCAAAIRARKPA